ncbi:MAG: glycosyltransferase [Patescibacteria group bacterium]
MTYIENIRLPTEKAHGYQIMKTCEALARVGVEIDLVVADRKNVLSGKDSFEYYGMPRRFSITRLPVIDCISSVPAPLKSFAFALERWSFSREVRRRRHEWSGDIFYTRDVGVAESLVDGGKPVFVELHDAPRSFPSIAGWVVISQALKNLLITRGIQSEQIHVSQDCFDEHEIGSMMSKKDARRELGILSSEFLVVYSGHLFSWKGVDGIASAFQRIPSGISIAIVGGNPGDVARVQSISGVTSHVRFTGHLHRAEVMRWLAAADATILSTSAKFGIGRLYTSPLKLFEYLAAGLPVIASDVPSSREILDESIAMFYRADDATDFLRALTSLAELPHVQRQRMGETAKAKVNKHTWTKRGENILAFLRATGPVGAHDFSTGSRHDGTAQSVRRVTRCGLLIFTQVVNENDENLGFFVSWLRKLASDGRRIYVACWSYNPATKLPANVTVHKMSNGKIRRTLALLRFSWSLRQEVSSVFVHMIAPVVVAAGWFWRLLGWKITLWYTHGSVPWTLRVSEKIAHHILTATEDSMRIPSRKKIVMGHGIDLERFCPASVPREPLLLTIGRISQRKDQLAFIALCDLIRSRASSLAFRAMIVGDPRLPEDIAYTQRVKEEIARLGLADIVTMSPSLLGDALVALYSRSAIFASPSRTGSLDKVVLEALACETPVVAVGSSYRGFSGVTLAPSLTDDAAVDAVLAALRHPAARPVAREGVKKAADIDSFIGRLRTVL